jgi:hypothetical protein
MSCRFAIARRLSIVAAIAACGRGAPAPTPGPAPVARAPGQPTISQTCPDASDGRSVVVQAIEDSRRAMGVNPTGPVPPVCLLTAFVHIAVVPDSVNEHALGIAAELDRRGATPRDLLPAEIALLSRARRYQDVSRAYDRLIAVDPRPSAEIVRYAIVAAHQRADTVGLLRLLTAAEARPDAPAGFRAERVVLQQIGALYSAIAEARGFVRQNPKNLTTYPSLVGNFGTLGNADSVVAYVHRATAQGATRANLASAIDPFVNTMLRHATLYGAATPWDVQMASAARVDSAISTPSTAFLLASLIVYQAEPEIAELGPPIEGTMLGAGSSSAEISRARAAACGRIAPLSSLLDAAAGRLRDGGNRYAGGGVQQLSDGIAAERSRLDPLRTACARAT